MNLETLKSHVESCGRRQPFYFYKPDQCPFNASWEGKMFIGHLFFKDHKNVFQVFECPMCGKRDVVEIAWNEIDIDDPRYARGGLLTADGEERVLGIKADG